MIQASNLLEFWRIPLNKMLLGTSKLKKKQRCEYFYKRKCCKVKKRMKIKHNKFIGTKEMKDLLRQ